MRYRGIGRWNADSGDILFFGNEENQGKMKNLSSVGLFGALEKIIVAGRHGIYDDVYFSDELFIV